MIEVIVVGEGQTEETFVRDVLAPPFGARDIFFSCPADRDVEAGQRRRPFAGPRGEFSSQDASRARRYLRDDLVRLVWPSSGLPRRRGCAGRRPIARCTAIEAAFANVVTTDSGCRPDRFLAHIQPYEFEALLFSDVSRFGEVQSGWTMFVPALQQARDAAQSPEHINDGLQTHPSARLKQLRDPSYDKPLHGSRVAERIGIGRMRRECAHFEAWLARIENLPPLK